MGIIRTEVSGAVVFVVDSGPPVHRRPILPGQYVGAGVWSDTDISGEQQVVKDACADTWTPSALAAYKAANPWVDPVSPEPHLNGGGLARFAGAAPITVYESIHMAGVTRVSKGRYRVLHEVAMPTDQYSVFPSVFDPLPRSIRITARTTTYVEVRVTDVAGAVQDPTEICVKTERVIS